MNNSLKRVFLHAVITSRDVMLFNICDLLSVSF